MTSPITVDTSRTHVTRVTLDSPTTNNSLHESMSGPVLAALDQAEADPGTRVFVIAAQGHSFCAGMPLGDPSREDWRLDPAPTRALLSRVSRSPLITVAVVNGSAVGGGVGLAAACDQVIAGPRASFRLTEVLLGVIPALVLPLLAQRIGVQRAFSLALTTQEVLAPESVAMGLSDRWSDDPENGLRSLLRQLRRADWSALSALKRYRADLCPGPNEELAVRALREQLNAPETRRRLTALQQQELIP
jgi:polyketide biosynthesis enoyl-CoA hydratase PksH